MLQLPNSRQTQPGQSPSSSRLLSPALHRHPLRRRLLKAYETRVTREAGKLYPGDFVVITVAGAAANHTDAWNFGGEKALTALGNVVVRATYGRERDQDPVSGSTITDRLFKLDVRLMW